MERMSINSTLNIDFQVIAISHRTSLLCQSVLHLEVHKFSFFLFPSFQARLEPPVANIKHV